jgi:mannose-6-phosphate isomerase-like protein (cupin superfamily)
MKSSVFRILVTSAAILMCVSATAEDGWLDLGDEFEIGEATPIQAILDNPAAFHDREVRIEGRIASVCNEEGCFIEVVPTTGGGEGIVVNFPGLAHTFPLDCAGLEAVVEGRFYQKVYPHARVDHWQHHSFRPGIEVPEYSLAFRMDVRGARIGGTREAAPPPAKIRKNSADRVDLEIMGFEAEAFGIDRRNIAPGGIVPRPSTGGNRWMVLCRDGNVEVHRADAEPVSLRAGQMSFVPAGVVFDVRNTSDAVASFDLVYAKSVEPPSHSH